MQKGQGIVSPNCRYDLGVMGGALLGISDELAISEWAQVGNLCIVAHGLAHGIVPAM